MGQEETPPSRLPLPRLSATWALAWRGTGPLRHWYRHVRHAEQGGERVGRFPQRQPPPGTGAEVDVLRARPMTVARRYRGSCRETASLSDRTPHLRPGRRAGERRGRRQAPAPAPATSRRRRRVRRRAVRPQAVRRRGRFQGCPTQGVRGALAALSIRDLPGGPRTLRFAPAGLLRAISTSSVSGCAPSRPRFACRPTRHGQGARYARPPGRRRPSPGRARSGGLASPPPA